MEYKSEIEKFFKKMFGPDYVSVELDGTVDHQVFHELRFQWVNIKTKYSTVRVRLPMRVGEDEPGRDQAGKFVKRNLEAAPVQVAV